MTTEEHTKAGTARLEKGEYDEAISEFTKAILSVAQGFAEAHYKRIPPEILRHVRTRLTPDLWEPTIRFYRRYGIPEILEHMDTLD